MSPMPNKRTALERAFDLAKSGACSSLDDVRRCLKLEGYSLMTLTGRTLSKQLRDLISEARASTIAAESRWAIDKSQTQS